MPSFFEGAGSSEMLQSNEMQLGSKLVECFVTKGHYNQGPPRSRGKK